MNLKTGKLMTQVVAACYCNAVVMTENHLHFVFGHHIACKCLVNVVKFHVLFTKLNNIVESYDMSCVGLFS